MSQQRSGLDLGDLEMFVIDVLRHDIENVDNVVKMLNSRSSWGWRDLWPRDFTEDEVRVALNKLCNARLVSQLVPSSDDRTLVESSEVVDLTATAEDVWFKLEKRALKLWEEWEPPKKESS